MTSTGDGVQRTTDLTETSMDARPSCDFCRGVSEAFYDGKTIHGPWGFMCEQHFQNYGIGLGTGRGQRLNVKDERDD